MSRHKHKARGKVTQKLTRDGLVERNAATGEEERLSKRSTDFDIRQRDAAPNAAHGAVNDTRTRTDIHQSAKQRNRAAYRQAQERTQDAPTADVAEPKPDAPLQASAMDAANPDTPVIADVAANSETTITTSQSEQTQLRQEYGVPQRHPGKGQQHNQQFVEPQSADAPAPPTQSIPPKLQTERESKLNTDGDSALRFSRGEKPKQAQQKHPKLNYGKNESPAAESPQPQTSATQPIEAGLPENITLNADAPPSKEPESAPEHGETPSKLQTERESKLQTDGDSALRFSRDHILPQVHSKRPKPNYGKTESPAAESAQAQTAVQPPIVPVVPHSPLRFDEPEKLRFTEDVADSTPPIDKPTQQQRYAPPNDEQPQQTADVPSGGDAPVTANPPEAEPSPESESTPQSPLKEPESALKPDKESKLQFKPDDKPPEAVKPGRKLVKAQKQAEKSANKLEAAKSQLPAKKKLRTKVVLNEESGKPKRKLYFENEVKPQGEHLKGALPLRPVKAAGNSALRFGHGKMFQVERENVAVEASHKAEMTAEGGVRAALRRHKTAPYRKVEKLQRKAAKKSVNLTYRQLLDQNPKLKSNILSRMFQKRKIKKDYAKAAREAQKAAKRAKKAGSVAADAGKALVGVIKRHPAASAVVVLILLLLFCLMSLIGAFGGMGSGGLGGLVASTYLADDADMLAAEAAYSGMEAGLQNELDNYAASHPSYDEYVFNLDDIGHDPYVLMSILSSLHDGAWTADGVQATLAMLFERQYILTESVTTETRYRTETDPTTGESTEVPYTYYKCTVTLENFNLSHLPIYIMDEDRLSRYALFTATLGNRPDLFPVSLYPHASVYKDYGHYDIPPEYLADETFAAMITEAEKYLGMPYVWGGYSPKTSFDCSGFVSWVINHSGWNVGRLGAQGLYNISTPVSAADAKPGDLVFFHSTYNAPGITHVGLYVGDGMMLHAGDPIGYASIETAYFQQHFQAFGRLN